VTDEEGKEEDLCTMGVYEVQEQRGNPNEGIHCPSLNSSFAKSSFV